MSYELPGITVKGECACAGGPGKGGGICRVMDRRRHPVSSLCPLAAPAAPSGVLWGQRSIKYGGEMMFKDEKNGLE